MRFYTTGPQDPNPPSDAEYPCVVLSFDRWNDFGVRTQFALHYWRQTSVSRVCGRVKILQMSGHSTELPSSFTQLDANFCSLGQDIDYYRDIDLIGDPARATIFAALNDIVYRPALAAPFARLPEFETSLLRFSEAEKLYREGLLAFDFTMATPSISAFSFSCRLLGASADHKVEFNFLDREPLPGRIIAMIGSNGTGKTTYLQRLGEAVVNGTNETDGRFYPSRPSFSRVVVIAYSAFDEFKSPASDAGVTVHHCGIHDKDGQLKDLTVLASEIRENLLGVYRSSRMATLEKALREILPPELVGALTTFGPPGVEAPYLDVASLSLSSGQIVLLSILSSVALSIEPDSLLLFDEPEMHLHPNAIAGLMRAIHTALTDFRSYAVMATHSPLILQQLPSRYTRVFRRVDSIPVIDSLPVESFGENLTTITEEIFHAAEGPTLFGEWFRDMLDTTTPEQIGELFDGKLSFNAKTIVRSLARQIGPRE